MQQFRGFRVSTSWGYRVPGCYGVPVPSKAPFGGFPPTGSAAEGHTATLFSGPLSSCFSQGYFVFQESIPVTTASGVQRLGVAGLRGSRFGVLRCSSHFCRKRFSFFLAAPPPQCPKTPRVPMKSVPKDDQIRSGRPSDPEIRRSEFSAASQRPAQGTLLVKSRKNQNFRVLSGRIALDSSNSKSSPSQKAKIVSSLPFGLPRKSVYPIFSITFVSVNRIHI